jgi:hypothetical protein
MDLGVFLLLLILAVPQREVPLSILEYLLFPLPVRVHEKLVGLLIDTVIMTLSIAFTPLLPEV